MGSALKRNSNVRSESGNESVLRIRMYELWSGMEIVDIGFVFAMGMNSVSMRRRVIYFMVWCGCGWVGRG